MFINCLYYLLYLTPEGRGSLPSPKLWQLCPDKVQTQEGESKGLESWAGSWAQLPQEDPWTPWTPTGCGKRLSNQTPELGEKLIEYYEPESWSVCVLFISQLVPVFLVYRWFSAEIYSRFWYPAHCRLLSLSYLFVTLYLSSVFTDGSQPHNVISAGWRPALQSWAHFRFDSRCDCSTTM